MTTSLGNVGNLDITTGNGTVTLRMRHMVAGHPGNTLSFGEVRKLIARLERAITAPALLPDDEREVAPAKAADVEDLIG